MAAAWSTAGAVLSNIAFVGTGGISLVCMAPLLGVLISDEIDHRRRVQAQDALAQIAVANIYEPILDDIERLQLINP